MLKPPNSLKNLMTVVSVSPSGSFHRRTYKPCSSSHPAESRLAGALCDSLKFSPLCGSSILTGTCNRSKAMSVPGGWLRESCRSWKGEVGGRGVTTQRSLDVTDGCWRPREGVADQALPE